MIDWLGDNLLVVLGALIATVILFFIVRWIVDRIRSRTSEGKAQISYTD
jgi:uncharacterized membrane protein YdjX (TVP38/TMEM64 family)